MFEVLAAMNHHSVLLLNECSKMVIGKRIFSFMIFSISPVLDYICFVLETLLLHEKYLMIWLDLNVVFACRFLFLKKYSTFFLQRNENI